MRLLLFVFEYSYLHLNNSGGFMKKGFTLAEVLITLGIIGVVAAMTMPSLIQNYRKKEATTRIKKFYSMMSQAVFFQQTITENQQNGLEKHKMVLAISKA